MDASATCNAISGVYALMDGRLQMPEGAAMSEMGCSTVEIAEQERWLAGFLTSAPAVTSTGDTITLTSGSGAEVIELQRTGDQPTAPLKTTRWVLDPGGDPNEPSPDATLTLSITDTRITYDFSCGTTSADVQAVQATAITITAPQRPGGCDTTESAVVDLVVDNMVGAIPYSRGSDDRGSYLRFTIPDGPLILRADNTAPAPQDGPSAPPTATAPATISNITPAGPGLTGPPSS